MTIVVQKTHSISPESLKGVDVGMIPHEVDWHPGGILTQLGVNLGAPN